MRQRFHPRLRPRVPCSTRCRAPLGCSPGEVGQRVAMVMSGGTEGGLSPHLLVFAVSDAPRRRRTGAQPRDRDGVHPRDSSPKKSGGMAQVEATAEAVTAAMAQAGITGAEDVHYVQVKCPLLTSERVLDAAARGQCRGDRRYLRVDGLFARRLRAGRRAGARRGRTRRAER